MILLANAEENILKRSCGNAVRFDGESILGRLAIEIREELLEFVSILRVNLEHDLLLVRRDQID